MPVGVVGDEQVQAVEQPPQLRMGQILQALSEQGELVEQVGHDAGIGGRGVQFGVELGERCLVVADGVFQFRDAVADLSAGGGGHLVVVQREDLVAQAPLQVGDGALHLGKALAGGGSRVGVAGGVQHSCPVGEPVGAVDRLR
jgi:hypothetical protein